tara:strand:+ start:2501 stop:3958 length:1458 start_codon:yes stop_codon:yes gene_type:complete
MANNTFFTFPVNNSSDRIARRRLQQQLRTIAIGDGLESDQTSLSVSLGDNLQLIDNEISINIDNLSNQIRNIQITDKIADVIKGDSDISEIEDFSGTLGENVSYLFAGTNLNPDISNWDVSKVTNMEGMFLGNTKFCQDISSWNVSNVKNMKNIFSGATSFNQNIGNWDVGGVTNMSYMFKDATNFNQDLSWNVTYVQSMSHMFENAVNFNQDLSWNVTNVNDMSYMFRGATLFNGNITQWNLDSLENIEYIFNEASFFNQNITNWNVSNITNMNFMLVNASNFAQHIAWDICGDLVSSTEKTNMLIESIHGTVPVTFSTFSSVAYSDFTNMTITTGYDINPPDNGCFFLFDSSASGVDISHNNIFYKNSLETTTTYATSSINSILVFNIGYHDTTSDSTTTTTITNFDKGNYGLTKNLDALPTVLTAYNIANEYDNFEDVSNNTISNLLSSSQKTMLRELGTNYTGPYINTVTGKQVFYRNYYQ